MAEDDEVLDEVIDQGAVEHQVPARGDGAQGGTETHRQVMTVHLGLLAEKTRELRAHAVHKHEDRGLINLNLLPVLRQIMKESEKIS